MKEYNNKIDVIIPAYNVPDKILSRCLASIAMQECVDDVEVTIIDDASTEENYKAVIKNFEPLMKINLLIMDVNGGPGAARQYGIDNTSNELITFIDADDTFVGAHSLFVLRKVMNDNNAVMSIGNFEKVIELENNIAFEIHEENYTWLFGKMFKRLFLKENEIRFHPTSRANEDNGFMRICKFCATKHSKKIVKINKTVYTWNFSKNSITRANFCEYNYGTSKKDNFYGYIENMLYAIQYANNHNITTYDIADNISIEDFILETMVYIYSEYIMVCKFAKENSPKILEYFKRFYDEAYKQIEPYLKEEKVNKSVFNSIKIKYDSGEMLGVQPTITFQQFLDLLKTEDVKTEE